VTKHKQKARYKRKMAKNKIQKQAMAKNNTDKTVPQIQKQAMAKSKSQQ